MAARPRHRHCFVGEVLQPLSQRPLVAQALQFAAQRMGDRLGHVGLAQPRELPGELADLGIADADAHGRLRIYTLSIVYAPNSASSRSSSDLRHRRKWSFEEKRREVSGIEAFFERRDM